MEDRTNAEKMAERKFCFPKTINFVSSILRLCNTILSGSYRAFFIIFLNVGYISAAHYISRHVDDYGWEE